LFPFWIELVATSEALLKLKELGTFGDAFGSLNTLFSGLAFAAVSLSLHLQYVQGRETSIGLEEQRRKERIQAFERVFFQMLTLYNTNAIALELKISENSTFRGREVFSALYNDWRDRNHLVILGISQTEGMTTKSHFLLFHHCFSHYLDLHYGLLYEILRFIESEYGGHDGHYIRLVKAHLSSFECALLLYYAQSEASPRQLKTLVERFGLLERLPDLADLNFEDILALERSAYPNNPIYDTALAARAAA
jgi:hypothetical protein